MSSIPKNSQNFHFQKITKNGYLKLKIINGYFFEKLQKPKPMKTREKKKFEIKKCLTFYFRTSKWAKLFLRWTLEKNEVLFIFCV